MLTGQHLKQIFNQLIYFHTVFSTQTVYFYSDSLSILLQDIYSFLTFFYIKDVLKVKTPSLQSLFNKVEGL